MGLHERYSLTRQNLGHPHTILHVVTYPAAQLPKLSFMEARVVELQARLPMLHPRFVDTKTNHPGYVAGAVWPANKIVREVTFTPAATGHDESLALYNAEMLRFSAVDYDTEPMWAVTLASAPGAEHAYLLVAFTHPIIDGRGSSFMLRALTAENIDYIETETWEGPKGCDETVSTKPSLGFLLPIVFRELLLPKMPLFIQRPFLSDEPWPADAVKGSVVNSTQDIDLVSIDQDVTTRAKAAGKEHGVATLHPVVKMAWVAALWRVFHKDAKPFHCSAGSARDERNAELGHAAITHNYVSATEWEATLTGDEQFWDVAKQIAYQVSSDHGITEGRMTMGLLAHIPDPDVDPASKDYDPKLPTGWEKYFHGRATSENPYRGSASFSNLGYYALPPGATDAMWGQTASPFGPAYQVSINGHEGGVRLTASFRDGAVTDKQHTHDLHAVYLRVMERVAAGESDKTIDEITQ